MWYSAIVVSSHLHGQHLILRKKKEKMNFWLKQLCLIIATPPPPASMNWNKQ